MFWPMDFPNNYTINKTNQKILQIDVIKNFLNKIRIIYNIILNAPFSISVVFSNFIASFLSVIGIPILVVAYKFSENADENLIPFI